MFLRKSLISLCALSLVFTACTKTEEVYVPIEVQKPGVENNANGTSDGGGGNAEGSTQQEVKDSIFEALRLLQKPYVYFALIESNPDMALKTKEVFDKIFNVDAEPESGVVFDESKVRLLEKGSCPAADKKHADASVTEFNRKGSICFSIENLQRYTQTSLLIHVSGLWVHELSHLDGYSEKMATAAQTLFDKSFENIFDPYFSPEAQKFRTKLQHLKGPLSVIFGGGHNFAPMDQWNKKGFQKNLVEPATLYDVEYSIALQLEFLDQNAFELASLLKDNKTMALCHKEDTSRFNPSLINVLFSIRSYFLKIRFAGTKWSKSALSQEAIDNHEDIVRDAFYERRVRMLSILVNNMTQLDLCDNSCIKDDTIRIEKLKNKFRYVVLTFSEFLMEIIDYNMRQENKKTRSDDPVQLYQVVDLYEKQVAYHQSIENLRGCLNDNGDPNTMMNNRKFRLNREMSEVPIEALFTREWEEKLFKELYGMINEINKKYGEDTVLI